YCSTISASGSPSWWLNHLNSRSQVGHSLRMKPSASSGRLTGTRISSFTLSFLSAVRIYEDVLRDRLAGLGPAGDGDVEGVLHVAAAEHAPHPHDVDSDRATQAGDLLDRLEALQLQRCIRRDDHGDIECGLGT